MGLLTRGLLSKQQRSAAHVQVGETSPIQVKKADLSLR